MAYDDSLDSGKHEFHQRIESLINDGFLEHVGKWKDLKHMFEGVQKRELKTYCCHGNLFKRMKGAAILVS